MMSFVSCMVRKGWFVDIVMFCFMREQVRSRRGFSSGGQSSMDSPEVF